MNPPKRPRILDVYLGAFCFEKHPKQLHFDKGGYRSKRGDYFILKSLSHQPTAQKTLQTKRVPPEEGNFPSGTLYSTKLSVVLFTERQFYYFCLEVSVTNPNSQNSPLFRKLFLHISHTNPFL